jgi:acyl-[acyl carrier protein]--UDP-N-acetylglucosamine O-acyltransferase
MESSNAFAVTLTLPLAMASAVPQGISYTGLRQQLSREEWEDLKSTIRKLYIDENRTFSYIKEFLVKGHNFRPT